jgi:hypothetical protein
MDGHDKRQLSTFLSKPLNLTCTAQGHYAVAISHEPQFASGTRLALDYRQIVLRAIAMCDHEDHSAERPTSFASIDQV